jgi:hypothetical protein
MPIIGRIFKRIFEARYKSAEKTVTSPTEVPILPPKSPAIPLYSAITTPSSTINPPPVAYQELPKTGGWRDDDTAKAAWSSNIINSLRVFGAKLRPIQGVEELNSLPLHAVIFDALAYMNVPLRVIKFDYAGNDVTTVSVRIKTIPYNEDWSLNSISDKTLTTFRVCVVPGEKEQYVIAPIISTIAKEIDGPANWKIAVVDKMPRVLVKRTDSSVLLIGKKVTKDVPFKSATPLNSGDLVGDIVKCGGAFEKIKDENILNTIPLYTVVRTGNEYCRVVKITINYGGYIALQLRTVDGNRYVCGRLVDSVITDREESYKLFYVAKRGDKFITAPPVSETDTYQITGNRNYLIRVQDPISPGTKRHTAELESKLANRHVDDSTNRQTDFFGYRHSRVVHRTAVPILMIFDSKGRPVNKKAKNVPVKS